LIEEIKIISKTAPFIYAVSNEATSVKGKIILQIEAEIGDIIDSSTTSPVV
jgi:hypothetical protein